MCMCMCKGEAQNAQVRIGRGKSVILWIICGAASRTSSIHVVFDVMETEATYLW